MNAQQSFFDVASDLGFGEFHFKRHQPSGLHAIIAIHSTARGPALGGCRCLCYDSYNDAFTDALRLAQGMSFKAAVSNLPLGGGKAVIALPKKAINREELFSVFGEFVNDLGGRYITAEDSGTSVADMEIIRRMTPHVTGTEVEGGDPSPLTALGVRRGIEAAVRFKLDRENLDGIRVAIQGVGNVGYHLAKELTALGASLIVSDVNHDAVDRCVEEFGAKAVDAAHIHQQECDVFAPCALGSVLNERSIDELKTTIVAGGANNQLSQRHIGEALKQKQILYAPDYVINAGGLIYVAAQCGKLDMDGAKQKIQGIYDTTMEIFERAQSTGASTNVIADTIAVERLRVSE